MSNSLANSLLPFGIFSEHFGVELRLPDSSSTTAIIRASDLNLLEDKRNADEWLLEVEPGTVLKAGDVVTDQTTNISYKIVRPSGSSTSPWDTYNMRRI